MLQIDNSTGQASGLSQQQDRPQNGAAIVISRIACDPGNRQLKFGQTVESARAIPSVVKKLHPLDNPVPDRDSVVIRYLDGDNKALKGERWVVGALAVDLNGQKTFKTEKIDVVPYLALATIVSQGSEEPQTVSVNELRLCLPDNQDADRLSDLRIALLGWHQIQRNGVDINVRIRSIQIELEGVSAFKWCQSREFFKYRQLNGILDFGGGTTTGQLFSASGNLLRESRIILPGVFQLAQAIASDPCLAGVESKGFSPKVEIVLDGIANQTYLYGTTGRSFAPAFAEHQQVWIDGIRAELRTWWAQWLGEIAEVAVIGGSASLAESLVASSNGRFKIVPESTLATVRGMLL